MNDATLRLSKKVEAYIKSRPGYTKEIIETLRLECNLIPIQSSPISVSSTGILSEIILRNGNPDYGIEPNNDQTYAIDYRQVGHRRVNSNVIREFLSPRLIDGLSLAEVTRLEAAPVIETVDSEKLVWQFKPR